MKEVERLMARLTKRPLDPESVFRAERTLNADEIGRGVVIPVPSTDAYSPYGEKWKEFAKLEKLAKGGSVQWFHWIGSVILPGIGLLSLHRFSHRNDLSLLAFAVLVGLIGLARMLVAKERFTHWPCPRCGTKWPGTKTEKEPKCAICGLKLHQLTP
jgi:hypothetical protein